MSFRPLGRLQSKDERDNGFQLKMITKPFTGTPPTHKIWVPGAVLDQGNFPYCVGYAWEQFLQSSPVRTKTGQGPDVIYHTAQKMDEWPGENYDGTSVRGGAKAVASFGRLASYYWATNTTDVKNFILTTGTVVVGTNWYDQMFEPNKKGFVELKGNLAGGHAWLLIGWSESKKAFRAINSWGSSWGQKGRFWISEPDMQRLLDEDGEACTAVEQSV